VDDSELIASFEPSGGRHLLVMAFDDVEDMVLARERLVASFCGWTDEGERFDKAEVLAMTRGALGRREMLAGSVVGRLIVSSAEDDEALERLRKAVALRTVKRRTPVGATITEKWRPGPEQLDMLEKWADEAIAAYPAGGGWRPKTKPARIRKGFNAFCEDHGAPELALVGVHGGRALVDFLRARFRDEFEYLPDPSNPYIQGLHRKSGAKRSWFPSIQGIEE
jgi:hypothetical protein